MSTLLSENAMLNTVDHEVHPVAQLFPLLSHDELKELAADIEKHGLIHSIVLVNGKVLDGRNRLAACQMAGVDPRFEDYHGKQSPTEYVLSSNLRRRQLTASQRAAIAAEALPMLEAEAKERQTRGVQEKIPEGGQARDKAAKAALVNSHYVSEAKKIKATAPEVFGQIKAGDKTISEAKRELSLSGRALKEHDQDSDTLSRLKRFWRKAKAS